MAPAMGNAGWMPMLSISLKNGGNEIAELALVDSGAAVSVLPYALGVQLGFDWNQTPGSFALTGTLASYPTKPLIIEAVIGPLTPLRLAFGWTQAPGARFLLGQTNFFMEFDVFLFRRQGFFQIQPATP
jgi:hypothetical protein